MAFPFVQSGGTLGDGLARRHLLWVMFCALLVVGSTFLPYLYAYLVTPAGMQFQGILVLPQDLYTYLAKMQLGAQGEWLFRLTYTSEDHEGALLSVFYLALGRVSSVAGAPPIFIFHLARLVTGVLLLIVVFLAAYAVFGKADRAWTCFAITSLGSGLGWVTTLFGHLPSDLLIPESVTYYAIFANPHFPLGMSLMLLTFLAMLKAVEQQRAKYALIAGLLTLTQTFVLPFLVITVYTASFCWLAWRWVGLRKLVRQEMGYLAILVGVPMPGLINDYSALYLNPILREWTAQNVTLSPPPYDFLLGYGLIGLLAAAGAIYLWRMEKPLYVSVDTGRLLLAWVLVTLVLIYLPFNLQRRLSTGLHLSLSLLAVIGFYGYVVPRLTGRETPLAASVASKKEKRRTWRGLLIVLLVAMVPSNLFLLTLTALGAGSYPYPLYLRDGEVQALNWLSENTATSGTVLASDKTGNIIPALAGNRVFYGYPFETLGAEEKKALLNRFFAGEMNNEEEGLLLSKHDIAMIYYGRSERELGSFDPFTRPYLERVFGNDDVDIYRVIANSKLKK